MLCYLLFLIDSFLFLDFLFFVCSMKKCRPLTFWTEEQKEKFIAKEDFSYTVWRAANAIMDVRLEDMKLEIQARLENGEALDDIKFLGPGCYMPEDETKQ